MENFKINPGWEKLYNLNFHQTSTIDTPVGVPGLPEAAQAVAPTPFVSTIDEDNGKLGKKLLIALWIGAFIYVGYNIYKNYEAKKENGN